MTDTPTEPGRSPQPGAPSSASGSGPARQRRSGRFFNLPGQRDAAPAGATGLGMDNGRRIGITLWNSFYRPRLLHTDRIPADEPLVFVANHTNYVDGAVLFGLLPRRISFLIKAEAVRGPLGWLLTAVGQYAIKRGVPDRRPMLDALDQLKRGGCVGIFPEGTRGDGLVANVFSGAGWLAVRSGARVQPVAIRGTARPAGRSKWRRRLRPKVYLWCGEPFTVNSGPEQLRGKKAVDAATAEIQQRLVALVGELDQQLQKGLS
ncbi:lysophospholipid acyltransferase family protein [Nakamurella aerolata]|uniref:1-acyl-sn-glycerol-3-phosphate acyltransferase n=1 Tax=Nakamurella aerolata TaxID=1656892 RepID=A0A849AAK8_9ACTN|nr:lysophospholipid acyltransferase family protein [Nakamurella aerolata]NNG36161.1 1-acyl-sn-glycerol-3-phosphate acyltransferase [Nakamurella aerolata]